MWSSAKPGLLPANLAKCWALLLPHPMDKTPPTTCCNKRQSCPSTLRRFILPLKWRTTVGAAKAGIGWRHCVDDVITRRFSSSRHLDTNGKKTKGIETDHQLTFGDVWNWRNAKLFPFLGWKNQRDPLQWHSQAGQENPSIPLWWFWNQKKTEHEILPGKNTVSSRK